MNDQQEEKTLWVGHSSQVVNIGFFIFCVIFFIVLLVTVPFLFFIPFLLAGWKWLQLKLIKYEITNERIRFTKGIFSKQLHEMELYRVKDITFLQPFFLRLFSLGSIKLDSSDRSTPSLIISAIPNAQSLREEIRKNVEMLREKKYILYIDMR